MDFLKMAKDAVAMRSKMAEMDKALRGQVVETESANIKIKLNAKNEFLEINLPDEFFSQDKEKSQKQLIKAVNEAISKAQNIMAGEVKKIAGNMKLPM